MSERFTILEGDVRDRLRELADGSVDCVVTSPPYLWLRDYGTRKVAWPKVQFTPIAGLEPVTVPASRCSLGLEEDPWAYVGHLVLVFRELRRVLKETGTVWLNIGDKRVSGRCGGISTSTSTILGGQRNHRAARAVRDALGGTSHPNVVGLKPKDMLGLPWRVALALQADGWWLRQDVIWHKPNPQPENVYDRPSQDHEFVFLLTRARRGYFYDWAAIAEPVTGGALARGKVAHKKARTVDRSTGVKANSSFSESVRALIDRRNARTVWRIHPGRETEEHTATFSPELARRCIAAGCPADGLVLDPFAGLGTAGAVAIELGRRFVGIELSEKYAAIARERCVEAIERTGQATIDDARMKRVGRPTQLGLLAKFSGGAK